jgi:hypothetical protein
LLHAYELHGMFMAEPHSYSASPLPVPPLHVGEEVVYVTSLEEPGRVAAEAAVVIHMLSTASCWMASVDVSTIPLDIQETTMILTMQALGSALHFPCTHEVLEVFTVPVPSDGTGTLLGMDSTLDADPLHGTTPVPEWCWHPQGPCHQ